MTECKTDAKALNKVIVAICCALSAFFLAGVLSGCASQTPTEATQQFLDGVKANDAESIQEVYSGDPNTIFSFYQEDLSSEEVEGVTSQEVEDAVQNDLLPKLREFDYELSNEQVNGETATVDVKITTYAAGDAFSSFLSDYMSQAFTLAFSGASEDDLTQLAASIFSSKIKSMDKSYTETVSLALTKTDNTWKVDSLSEDSEMSDAFLGGLLSSFDSFNAAYGTE